MSEHDSLNVFLCGNVSTENEHGRELLRGTQKIIEEAGETVINERELWADLTHLSSREADDYHRVLDTKMWDSDFGLTDATYINPEKYMQLGKLATPPFNKRVGVSFKRDSDAQLPILNPRRMVAMGWTDLEDYARQIKGFLKTQQLIKSGKTVETPGNSLNPDLITTVTEEVLRTGDLEIAFSGEYVRYYQRKMNLTPLQYRVMEFLGLRVDEPVPYADILEHVRRREILRTWNQEKLPMAVTSSISKLNGKLQDRRYLESYKGFGYRLVDLRRYERDAVDGVLTNGPIAVDLTIAETTVKNEPVILTEPQRRLLVNLILNKEKTMSSDEAANLVWKPAGTPTNPDTVSLELYKMHSIFRKAGLDVEAFSVSPVDGFMMFDLSAA